MQAPRFRMNEREANPNEYIAFIRSLKKNKDHEAAEAILKAVAAQTKVIMKDRFMQVGTLEESAFNRVFAGINHNHGQVGIMVRMTAKSTLDYRTRLKRSIWTVSPQMNHGPKFQKLMAEIKADVKRMQDRGYFGDGFWSDGQRLADRVKMGGEGLARGDFPEYICGVSAADAKKTKGPGRGPASSRTPAMVKGEASHRSGAQTERKRRAGTRTNVDMGQGMRLDGKREITKEDRANRKVYIDSLVQRLVGEGLTIAKAKKSATEKYDAEHPWWKDGSTRGKVAKSKSAAQLRAEAIERRLGAVAQPLREEKPDISDHGDYSGEDDEGVPNDNKDQDEEGWIDPCLHPEERKKAMEEEMSEDEMEGLRGGWQNFIDTKKGKSAQPDNEFGRIGYEHEELRATPVKRERPTRDSAEAKRDLKREPSPSTSDTSPKSKRAAILPRFGKALVAEEQKRGLGLSSTSTAKSGKTLGSAIQPAEKDPALMDDGRPGWKCRRCTLVNLMDHGRCEVCQARPDGSIPDDVAM
ncbi:DNA-dependent metalloprotease WSS1, partial [Tremellales sp. Uapishka_1]